MLLSIPQNVIGGVLGTSLATPTERHCGVLRTSLTSGKHESLDFVFLEHGKRCEPSSLKSESVKPIAKKYV